MLLGDRFSWTVFSNLIFLGPARILRASKFNFRFDSSSRAVYDRGKGIRVWACSRRIFHPDYTKRRLRFGAPLFSSGGAATKNRMAANGARLKRLQHLSTFPSDDLGYLRGERGE
jgi:hypothetical protein